MPLVDEDSTDETKQLETRRHKPMARLTRSMSNIMDTAEYRTSKAMEAIKGEKKKKEVTTLYLMISPPSSPAQTIVEEEINTEQIEEAILDKETAVPPQTPPESTKIEVSMALPAMVST